LLGASGMILGTGMKMFPLIVLLQFVGYIFPNKVSALIPAEALQ